MTAADLHAWRDRHFGRYAANKRAAEALALPLETFLNQLYGRSSVSAQTERICWLIDEAASFRR